MIRSDAAIAPGSTSHQCARLAGCAYVCQNPRIASASDHPVTAAELERRTIRRGDLVAAENAFIDTRTPGSEHKLNYAIIGSGVSETEQYVNLDEPHGFQLGAASMPPGVTNSLHLHFTAEVFIVVAGTYTFRWGRRQIEGEYTGGPGDILSMPTWIFRGFSNVGGEENFIFTILGRDRTGGLIWHPEVLSMAEGHGLHLTVANRLIDEVAGDVLTDDIELVTPMPVEQLDRLPTYSPDDMRARISTDDDRQFVGDALLCTNVPGGHVRLALVIGHGMTERRDHRPRLSDPHGFSVAALRADPSEGILLHRHHESQVLVVRSGGWEVTVNDEEPRRVHLGRHDVLSVPAGAWRSIVKIADDGDGEAELIVITGGDGRLRLEWAEDVVERARDADVGLDANGYLAPWSLIRHTITT
jgi:mannose-6-phosphate isomerase-like protein (cupin superfamily)